ncbi:hypothetical protein HS088_TW21G00444 [Tripterygium wilfordii]|uniref:SBP-type domain-containing protein n=1 Tax=Tripterygium wilfordii TaxID=458696 RepID=A0A7J7C361_TRIWF|nr:squamosa promoter-binding-like protein 3 [Tripterygium wilfordii]KAF5728297.1 hypothetical protein HS088_TW21G00444 [Tripterygium wilfordii]
MTTHILEPTMDARTLEQTKRSMKDKASMDNEEEFEDEMEEEDGGGGGGGDDRRKGVYGRKGSSSGGGGVSLPSCQVERCSVDLTDAKRYHRRHKVCEVHAKSPAVIVSGLRQRFCQQCSRFHELLEFDEAKRSCRRRLAGHNERRRKSSTESYGESTSRKGSSTTPQIKENQCWKTDERSGFYMNVPGGSSTYNRHSHIK